MFQNQINKLQDEKLKIDTKIGIIREIEECINLQNLILDDMLASLPKDIVKIIESFTKVCCHNVDHNINKFMFFCWLMHDPSFINSDEFISLYNSLCCGNCSPRRSKYQKIEFSPIKHDASSWWYFVEIETYNNRIHRFSCPINGNNYSNELILDDEFRFIKSEKIECNDQVDLRKIFETSSVFFRRPTEQ